MDSTTVSAAMMKQDCIDTWKSRNLDNEDRTTLSNFNLLIDQFHKMIDERKTQNPRI